MRSMDGKKSVRVDGLSKLTKIEELREKLVDLFEAEAERQRLFYRGKMVCLYFDRSRPCRPAKTVLFKKISYVC